MTLENRKSRYQAFLINNPKAAEELAAKYPDVLDNVPPKETEEVVEEATEEPLQEEEKKTTKTKKTK